EVRVMRNSRRREAQLVTAKRPDPVFVDYRCELPELIGNFLNWPPLGIEGRSDLADGSHDPLWL
ncbi:MAG: hypothetical protein ABI859_15615, partial [Pseudomonadota bacterium]